MRLNRKFKMLLRNILCKIVLISIFFISSHANVMRIYAEEESATAESDSVTSVKSGDDWYDTEGNLIQAHGGNIITYNGKYYWVGEDKSHNKSTFKGVNLYSSEDLMNWTYEGALITTDTIGPDGEVLGTCTIERPKLIYNEETNKFVLWAHWENGSNYTKSKLLVATCDTINGAYQVQKIFNPGEGDESINDGAGYRSLDFTVYADSDNGEAWIISASGSNLMVYPLTDTYDDIDMTGAYMIFKGVGREAPALVRSGGYYYLFTSGQSGWYPNQCKYAYTEDISDPEGWSGLDYVGNNTTYYSQPANIAVITQSDGTEGYIYMGDRWNSSALGASAYVWLPLEFYGTKAILNYSDDWSFDSSTGTFAVPEPTLVSEGKTAAASVETVFRPAGEAVDGVTHNRNTSGDSTNYFKPSSTVPFTWQVDLGKEYDLNRVDISFRIYNGSEVYYQYTLEGSKDETTWVQLVDASNNTTVGFKSHSLTGIEETYRFIRINCSAVKRADNNSSAAWAAGITELQVYADNLTNKEILQEWYSRYADKEQGYYTEESFSLLTGALEEAADLLENNTAEDSAYAEAADSLKTAVKGLAYKDTLPVKITGSIGTTAVYVNQTPELQDTITVTTGAGDTSEAEIEWYGFDENAFSENYSTVTVYGQVKYTDLKVSGTVEVVPANLLYFIDSGSLAYGSNAYSAVSEFLGGSLINKEPDQKYIAGTNDWGYTSTSSIYTKAQTAVVDKFTSGIYGNPLTYVVQLPQAGTYNIAVGATDWWGSNKVMTLKAVYTDAAGKQQTITLDTEYTRNLNVVTLKTYQITVNTATELKLTGTGNPAFSFIGIAKVPEVTGLSTAIEKTNTYMEAGDTAMNWTQTAMEDVAIQEELADNSVVISLNATAFAVGTEAAAANVSLNWATDTAADRYEVYRSKDADTGYEMIYSGTGVSYFDYDLEEGTYYYKVSGIYGTETKVSKTVSVETFPIPEELYEYDNQSESSLITESTLKVGNIYYGYSIRRETDENGNDTKAIYIMEQTSEDGIHWSDTGNIVMDKNSDPLLEDCKLESVNIRYIASINKMVMWAHWEIYGSSYANGKALVATASPGEDFTVHHIYNPLDIQVRDMSFFLDDDGTGYLAAAGNVSGQGANATIYLFKMNETYNDVVEITNKVLIGQYREAPQIIKKDGYYYLFTSQAAGWYPSKGGYISAAFLDGDWSGLRNIGNTSTFSAQSGGIVTLGSGSDTSYLMMANRWIKGEGTSGNSCLPVYFSEGYAYYDYYSKILYNPYTGLVVPVQAGRLLSQDKESTASIETNEGKESYKAFDGNYYTAFQGTGSKQWPFYLQVDLEQACAIRNIQISWYMYKGSEAYYVYSVEGSLDGSTWYMLADRTDEEDTLVNSTYGFTSDIVEGEAYARFLRVNVKKAVLHNNPNNWYTPTVYEIKIFGDENREVQQ